MPPRFDKLFHVLVVLGAASCTEDGTSSRDRQPDAAPDAAPTADAPETLPDGAELQECFCDQPTCCDRSVSPPQIQEGFTCCWSTTCA